VSADASPTIRRNAVWALLAEASRAVFAAALVLYVTRALGPDDYGLFALALGIGGLALLPADFGVSNAAGRFAAERRGDRDATAGVVADALRAKLVVTGGVALLLVVLAGPIADAYGEPGLEAPLRWTALALFSQSMFSLFVAIFVSIGRVSLQTVLFAIESFAELAFVVLAVVLAGGAASAALGRAAAFTLGAVLGLVLTWRLLGARMRPRVRTHAGPGRQLIGYAGALFIVDAAFVMFANIDILLIGAYLGNEAVGLFEAPLRLTIFFMLAGTAAASAIAPRVARHESEGQATEALLAGLRGLIVLGALAGGFVLAWASPIIDVLLGDEYAESAAVLRMFSPYLVLAVVGPLATRAVDYVGMAGRRIPVVLVALGVNALVDVLLLREIGIEAGALGTGIAYAIYCPIHVWFLHQALGLDVGAVVRTTVRALLAAAAMAGVLALLGTDSDVGIPTLLAGGVLGLLTFVAVLVLTREVTVAELRAVPAQLRALRR
jgi:stage V sporulation protein B